MQSATGVKRLRTQSQDRGTVGPSPNTVKRLKTRAAKQASKQVTSLSQQAIDAIECVASDSQQNAIASSPVLISPERSSLTQPIEPCTKLLQQQINELTAIVEKQNGVIQGLKNCIELLTDQIAVLPGQLTDIVLRMIPAVTASSEGLGSKNAADTAQTGEGTTRKWAEVAGSSGAVQRASGGDRGGDGERTAAPGISVAPRLHDAIAAVYVDQHEHSRRANNIVISGLHTVPGVSDRDVVSVLVETEFGFKPHISYFRRLGRMQPGRIRQLLVTMQHDEATWLVKYARYLRKSDDAYVQNSVYINADHTRAEALAAYEIRCRRRQAVAARAAKAAGTTNSDSVQLSRTFVNRNLRGTADADHPSDTARSAGLDTACVPPSSLPLADGISSTRHLSAAALPRSPASSPSRSTQLLGSSSAVVGAVADAGAAVAAVAADAAGSSSMETETVLIVDAGDAGSIDA